MQNLSTKEVNYIRDLLSWELLSTKKCYQFAQQETDPNNQRVFYDTANIHQQNYNNLLGYMDSITKKQGGRMQ